MKDPKLNAQMNCLGDIIEKQKEKCRKVVWETVDMLINDFPEYKDEIMQRYREICKTHNVDFLKDLRIDGKDIADFVNNNTPKPE